jgi:hypothetical protein
LPDRDGGGNTGGLDHPPHRPVGADEDLAGDLQRAQVRTEPEQDPEACAVDVAQTGEVERDLLESRADYLQDLVLGSLGIRQVDFPRDADATNRATAEINSAVGEPARSAGGYSSATTTSATAAD